jgi:hypothetical protein
MIASPGIMSVERGRRQELKNLISSTSAASSPSSSARSPASRQQSATAVFTGLSRFSEPLKAD